ncbi:MAG: hypothetical protein IJI98_08185, partial [Methanosphaera sp.]|nr:hypothetical protein [Methanosphaera sp.]
MTEVNNENTNNIEKISKTINIDSTNFDDYVTNGKFNENVSEGDTIDITGKLDGSRFSLEVDKPVNIISSNGEGYIDFKTISTDTYGSYEGGIFYISKGGSGSNVTGITFHNTHLRIENTSNIHIDNINSINIGQAIGKGVGAVSIREGSENISITNSYFRTENNGGHSNVVFAAAYNCLFENNTIEGVKGNNTYELIGNLLYLTTYNVRYAQPMSNINITIRNNKLLTKGIPAGEATCYGLVLEGKGHIIENNYIDTNYPVMAQYADVDYDFETNIDGIIFNNNTIARNTPQLVFPGIVSNNTFYGGATLKQVSAYNNKYNTVTILNNVVFENNTANSVTVTGDNNVLDNNEIYSNEDYAVTISGNNNTLNNNKIAGYLGRGENAISNSTEITSINNSEDISRLFYIDDDNFEKYFSYRGLSAGKPYYDVNKGIFSSGDILVFDNINITDVIIADKNKVFAKTDALTIINSTNSISIDIIQTVINCKIMPEKTMGGTTQSYIINSTVYKTTREPTEVINSTIFVYNKVYQYPKDNIYAGDTLTYQHLQIDTLPAGSIVYFMKSYSVGINSINFTNPITIEGLFPEAYIDYPVIFNESSQGSVVKGITFKGKVTINDANIYFANCTFMNEVEVNNDYITFESSVFNSKVKLNGVKGILFEDNIFNSEETPLTISSGRLINIENNQIITAADNTIVFDDESNSNTVRNNLLTASTLLGDDSVVGGDNIVEDNGAAYNTSIEIVADESLFKNDVSNVTVTVYNLLNNTPVDKGYVEVYLDGILQGIKPLVNGQITLEVNTNKSSFGSVPLKVWYYDGIRYANNVSSISVNVVKSNVSISLDEFTAKLNEKATVTATFLNQNGNPVQDTNVTFTVGRSSYTAQTENGVATIEELVTNEWLDAGKIIVAFPITEAYNSNSTTITLNTSKADIHVTPSVTVEGSTANINLALTDDLNSNVTDGKVTITTLDGTQLASGRVSNGVYTATVTIPDDYTSEYLVANFTGSYYYNDFVRNVKITQMLNSTISLETNSPLYGEELVITGRLVDSKNTPISSANLTLNLNGSKVIVTTNDDGEYNYTYTPGLGVNSLTVTFDGTVDVYGSSASKDVTIRDTDREMNEVLNRLDDLQKENEKLQEQLEQLQEQNNKTNEQLDNITQANNELKEQLDNLTKDNNDLSKQLNDTKNNLTQQNNDLQEQNKELNDKLDNTAKNLTDANKALQEQNKDAQKQLDNLSKANDELKEQLTNTTKDLIDSNNDLKEQNKALQDQNKQLNDKLDAILKQLEDSVAKNTVITINSIPGARFGQNVTISGKLSDCDGNVIASSPVSVSVGGIAQKVTTDKDGVYNLTVRASVVGDNTVVVSFDADNKYNYAENTTTFKVTRQNLVLKLDSIKSVYYGDKVKITGVLSDANGKLIANTLLNLDINGKTVKVKTVAGGKFTYTVAAKTVGTNNVTVSYNGNKNYNGVSAKKTFKVYKQ